MRLKRTKPATNTRPNRSRSTGDSLVTARRPAFSYYSASSRPPAAPVGDQKKRSRTRQQASEVETLKRARQKGVPRSIIARLPYWILIFVLIICAFKILLITPNPKVVIIGTNSVSSNYIQSINVYQKAAAKLLSSNLANRNKLTFSSTEVIRSLQKQFPELESISVALPIVGNRPIVYLAAVQPSLVLQSNGNNYAMSQSGVVLAQIPSFTTGTLPLQDKSDNKPVVGQRAVPATTISFAETVAYQLKAAGITVTNFILPSTGPYEIDARPSGKSYLLRFNIQTDVLEQSGAVVAVLRKVNTMNPAQYIDARVPGRIYYK